MGFSLKDFLEEATAQVNPFDKGKTGATVRSARKAPPAKTLPRDSNPYDNDPQVRAYKQKKMRELSDRYKAGKIKYPSYEQGVRAITQGTFNNLPSILQEKTQAGMFDVQDRSAKGFVKAAGNIVTAGPKQLTQNVSDRLTSGLGGYNNLRKEQLRAASLETDRQVRATRDYSRGKISPVAFYGALGDSAQAESNLLQTGEKMRRAGSPLAATGDAIEAATYYGPVGVASKAIGLKPSTSLVSKTLSKATISQTPGIKGALNTAARQSVASGTAREISKENPTIAGGVKEIATQLPASVIMSGGAYLGGKALSVPFGPRGLTPSLLRERNKWVTTYNEALAKGKPDIADYASRRIDEIDRKTMSRAGEAVDKRIPRVRGDGDWPRGKTPLDPEGQPLIDPQPSQSTSKNSSKNTIPPEIQRIKDRVDMGELVGRSAYAKLMQWEQTTQKGIKPSKSASTQPVEIPVLKGKQAPKPTLSQEPGIVPQASVKNRATGKATELPDTSQSRTPSELQRGFIKTVLDNPNTSPKVKKSISSLYKVRNTKELQTKAANLVKDNPDVAEQLAKNSRDDTSVAVAMELVKKHQNDGNFERAIDLVEGVAKDLTEAGRTAQAASIYGRLTPEGALRFTQSEINKYNKATGKSIKLEPDAAQRIKKLADEAEKLPEGYDKQVATQKLILEIQNTMPAPLSSKISTLQTIAQLLNPKTIIRNEVGNKAFKGLENISQTVSTPVDTLLSLFTGKRTTTLPSLKTQAKSGWEGRKKGIKESYQGINTGPTTQYELNSVPVYRGKVLGNLEKTMGAALRGGDRANYTAAFDDSIRSQLKIAKTDKVTSEMLEQAHHMGLYRTFQDKNVISNFFVGMKQTLNKVGFGPDGKRFGLGDIILKYPKTPANLLSRGIDYSPAGFVKTVFEGSKPLFGKPFDQKAFSDSFSRALVGSTGLVGTGIVLGSLGIITESPEKDKDLRDLQKQSGQGGYQINVSALKRFVMSGFNKDAAKLREGDMLVSYDWAQPAAIPLSMGAAIAKGKSAKEGAGKSASSLTEGIQTITEQPMVRGLQRFFGSNQGAGDVIGDLIKDIPASFIPTASNQLRQLVDNTNRNTYDPNPLRESLNRVLNRIPGLSENVAPRVGSLGDDRENYQNGSNNPFNVFLNPAFVSNYQPKDSAQLPLDIYNRSGETSQAPRSTGTTQKVNGENMTLTAKQNEDFQRYVGEETDKAFRQLSKDPAFMKLSDEDKAKRMSGLLTDINKAGKILVLGDEGYGTDAYKPGKLDKGVKAIFKGDYRVKTSPVGTASTYQEKYDELKAELDDPNSDLSDVHKTKKGKELRKLEIQKNYDEDTVGLYDMSKSDMYDFIKSAENGDELGKKLIAYDKALYDAGLIKYRKYKNGLAPSSRSGRGGKGGRKAKFDYKLFGFGTPATSLNKSLRAILNEAQLK